MVKKGDIVLVNQEVYGIKSGNKRILYKPHWFKPHKGIVLGFSFIHTGTLTAYSDNDYDVVVAHELKITKSHKVWVIEPLNGNGNRYLQPIRCLESDIELISKGE